MSSLTAGVFEEEHYNSDMSQSGWLDIKEAASVYVRFRQQTVGILC